MTTTAFTTSSDETVKLWSKKLLVETKKRTWIDKFVGTGSDNIIQVLPDTSKEAGDRVRIPLRMQLTGDGTSGDSQLANSGEEALSTYVDDVYLGQLRHAVQSAGRLTNQMVQFNIRNEAASGLADWWSTRMDVSFMNQLAGNTAQTNTKYTGMQSCVAPSDDDHHIIAGGGSPYDETVIDSADTFNLSYIDYCVERAGTITPAIRPVKVGGKEYYVMFLHPYQVTSLRTNTSTGQWLDIQKAAISGGAQNRIFDGSLGVYNGVILHASANVPSPTTNVRRAIFCGAQAGAIVYGRDGSMPASIGTKNKSEGRMTWVEETFDYGNRIGISAGQVFGLKKLVFNSVDFATIVVSTYAAQTTV